MRKIHETRKVLPGCERRVHRGVTQAKIRVDGSDVWCDLTSSGRAKILRPEWHASLRMADGKIKLVRLARDRGAAESMLHRLRVEQEQRKAGIRQITQTSDQKISELTARFATERARGKCTDVYLANSQRHLTMALNELSVKTLFGLRGLTRQALADWILPNTGRTAKKHRLIQLKVFASWLIEQELLTEPLPLPRLSMPTLRQRRPLRRAEVDKLQSMSPWRRGLFWALAFCTLARRSALLALRKSDIKIAGKKATIFLHARSSKTKTNQELPIPPRLIPDLQKLLDECDDRQFVFSQLGNNLNFNFDQDLKKAGIAKVTADGVVVIHSLRHGGATELLEKGVSVLLVQRMGGWKSLAMLSKHYGHLSPVRSREEIDAAFY